MNSIENEVRHLTQANIAALAGAENTNTTYLRLLVTESIKALGAEPRSNNASKRPKLTADAQAAQLKALDETQAKFAAYINDEVDKSLASVAAKDRAAERNRRTNFARTAIYTARRYVKAGKDLTGLAPKRITKSAMAVTLTPRPPTPQRLKGRVERLSKSFIAAVLELSDADKGAAVAELDLILGQLTTQMTELGVVPVRNASEAMEKHVPLKVGQHLFMPTQTQVIRQRARPS